MIPGTVIQPRAVRDAEEIYAYIAKDNVDAARRFNVAAADTLIAMRDNPKLGIARVPAADGLPTSSGNEFEASKTI